MHSAGPALIFPILRFPHIPTLQKYVVTTAFYHKLYTIIPFHSKSPPTIAPTKSLKTTHYQTGASEPQQPSPCIDNSVPKESYTFLLLRGG